MSNAIIEAIEVTETIEVTEAVASPTTKIRMSESTEPTATPPALTGDEFEQVVTTKIVRKRIGSLDPAKATWGWFAPHFGCPSGKHLVLRNGQTVLVAADFIRNTDTVINVVRVPTVLRHRQSEAQINQANKLFLEGEFEAERYLDQLAHFLSTWTAGDQNVPLAFLQTVRERLVEGYCPRNRFARKLRNDFFDYCEAVYPGLLVATEEDRSYEALKKKQTEGMLARAYQLFLDGDPVGEISFYLGVRNFCLPKIGYNIKGFPEIYTDADDWAQDVVEGVWKGLAGYRGGVEGIVGWVSSIVRRKESDAFNEALKSRNKFIPIILDGTDAEGEITRDENPLLISEYMNGQRTVYPRKLPDWIQGTDLLICKLIREDLTYKQIGRELGIGESVVKQRIARMKKRIQDEKAAEARLTAEAAAKAEEQRQFELGSHILRLLWLKDVVQGIERAGI